MESRGRLLLVEDEHTLRQLVARFLRVAGHVVVEAADGQEGVDRFSDSGPFDLALVDLNLPILCGVEVCRRILRIFPDQPILICSAAIVAESEGSLRDLGVNHFLTKPYLPDALLSHIRERLSDAPTRSNSPPPPAWTLASSRATDPTPAGNERTH